MCVASFAVLAGGLTTNETAEATTIANSSRSTTCSFLGSPALGLTPPEFHSDAVRVPTLLL